jgi:PAS domain S-box-containing protein
MKHTILVAEDEAIVAADLSQKLGLLGYEVVGTTPSGEDAVRLALDLQPELVLMDIRLYGSLDGIGAAAMIRAERDIPVVFVTAHSDSGSLDRAKLTEPFGYVIKPFEERELRTVIEIALHRHRIESALRESEDRLQLALRAASAGTWEYHTEADALVASDEAQALHGWKQTAQMTWDDALSLVVGEHRPAVSAAFRRSVETGAPLRVEFQVEQPRGGVRWLASTAEMRNGPRGRRLVGLVQDVTERKAAEELVRRAQRDLEARVQDRTAELARANEALRAEMLERQQAERARADLLGRLVFAQEDERRRIGREMHDRFGEHLTALGHRLGSLRGVCVDRPHALTQIDALEEIAAHLDRDVDALVWELRPTALDDLGLPAALAHHVRTWSTHCGVSAELHTAGLTGARVASAVETTLYRITQEALTNVAKHSSATHVDILLERRPDHVSLIVEDNGVGFVTGEAQGPARGAGLSGMRERAALIGATLQVESSPGRGTTILVRTPVAKEDLEHAV